MYGTHCSSLSSSTAEGAARAYGSVRTAQGDEVVSFIRVSRRQSPPSSITKAMILFIPKFPNTRDSELELIHLDIFVPSLCSGHDAIHDIWYHAGTSCHERDGSRQWTKMYWVAVALIAGFCLVMATKYDSLSPVRHVKYGVLVYSVVGR